MRMLISEVGSLTIGHYSISAEEARQLREFLNANYWLLRPNKKWTKCSHESHPDDCECEGLPFKVDAK